MLALFTNTSNRQIISRSEASAPSESAATPHRHDRIDADGERLLSPHEIAILMVLASRATPSTCATSSIAVSFDWMQHRLPRRPPAYRPTGARWCCDSPEAIAPGKSATSVSRLRFARSRRRDRPRSRTTPRADLYQFHAVQRELPLSSSIADRSRWP
ncbi:hypothetical protein [Burkholderia sp. FL-7-2-10-S1-D7]|uniref:hypothetical protein n=1 Tax=Burkholderia sp. FL-7-2-10-S1-D7 TaxID=1637866 RepID=UPI00211D5E41|nr:hypothetical protein [Burkholderia sp. FL-7-2-10-S1-D7]